jgi:hypothetical protein
MTDKIITLATEKDALQLRAAIFEKWKADELERRGDTVLDRDGLGRPLDPQVTTEYVGAPAPALPNGWTPGDPVPDPDLKTVVVDAVVEAMHGEVVPVPLAADVAYAVAVVDGKPAPVDDVDGKQQQAIVIGKEAGVLIDGVPHELFVIDVSAAVEVAQDAKADPSPAPADIGGKL